MMSPDFGTSKGNSVPLRAVSAFEITGGALEMDVLSALEELQLDNGPDLIVELIDLYLQELPQRLIEIREASMEAKWTLLKRAAHNLKGSSGSLGVCKVSEICQKLEGMDSRDSPETVEVLVRLLEHESARASAELAAVRRRRLG